MEIDFWGGPADGMIINMRPPFPHVWHVPIGDDPRQWLISPAVDGSFPLSPRIASYQLDCWLFEPRAGWWIYRYRYTGQG
jgi:hypothetical protein